ncbi:hypothetical protein Esi_0232_0043 [Ectocarpus siliculosus]|uniref:Uncharacterized protein n=1 Tax=Ectocarpus siliculosus TaxID=2880 RepID=D7FSE9_ECTSI|nr:hypothetical protein Esi_0232_0043 [Ectocarpus siliculosus]|eukprot:CBJ31090.1 hypothetical protein Esi_0232_0043 [Ectocarpus siliculosus]
MGRWTVILAASALLSSSEAFLLPLPWGSRGAPASSAATAAAGGASRPVARQPAARGLVPTLVPSPAAASRALKTRICAGPLEDFSTEKDYDRFLGELIFSQSDVRDDVLKSLDKAGDAG